MMWRFSFKRNQTCLCFLLNEKCQNAKRGVLDEPNTPYQGSPCSFETVAIKKQINQQDTLPVHDKYS